MKTQEWRFTDKSEWGAGQWQDEPDKVQWQDEATGLPCLIVRSPAGALCGYVGVSQEHPCYGKGYDDVAVEVHGGLTFADKCSGTEHGICHVVEPGEPDDVWWLGFDCAHAFDLTPRYAARYGPDKGDVYRDVEYVRGEVARLALQLSGLKSQKSHNPEIPTGANA